MRRIFRKISVCAISGAMLIAFAGCGGQDADQAESLDQEEIAEIVEEFQQGNYEYRKISTSGPDRKEVFACEGKVIRDPYEEYVRVADEYAELSSAQSETYYTGDVSGYRAQVKSPDGSIVEQQDIQPPALYGYGEDLSFSYDRSESVDGVQCDVYASEYGDTVGGEADRPNTEAMEITIRQEYYIDPNKKQVVRVDTDLGEWNRASAIANEMMSAASTGNPISLEEAEKNVENRDFSSGEILEISNFNGDIDVQPLK